MSIHLIGTCGLVVFVIGTLRPINVAALALMMTFLVGLGVDQKPTAG